jgi:filamentous hemagglutinin
VVFPTSESELRHIFRKAEGHVEDTPENRQLLLLLANDMTARLESDQYGNAWAVKVLPDGRQAWVQIRGEKIVNAGFNAVPREFNTSTGLKKP